MGGIPNHKNLFLFGPSPHPHPRPFDVFGPRTPHKGDRVIAAAVTVKQATLAKMAELGQKDSPSTGGSARRWPVLDGMAAVGLSGRDVAMVVGVTAPTVSKWRSGRIRVPAPKLAFLTLVLAHLLEEFSTMIKLEAEWGTLTPNWSERADPDQRAPGDRHPPRPGRRDARRHLSRGRR